MHGQGKEGHLGTVLPLGGPPRLPQLTGLVLALLGLLVLFGWANGLPVLTRVGEGLPHMMPNTAMGMIALGVGFLSWDSTGRGARHVMVAAGVAAAALGSATIWEYLTGVDLGIDLLLFADRTAVAPHPGRMALATALSFSLAGFGLLLLRRSADGAILIGQTMALSVVVLALSSVLAYLFGAQPPARLGVFSTMAVHTSLGLLAAGMAMLLLRPTSGLMAAVLGDELGATVLRKLLPGVLLLPAIIAYFRLVGHHTGWYGTEFAMALYVTAQIVVLTAGLWLVSRWLSRTDRKRREVEGVNRRLIDELTNARSALEATVAQRTSELVQSEAKFRSLLALSSDWYWEQDENLRFTFVSTGNEAQSALPAVDSLGKSSFELEIDWAPGQREQHEATLRARQPFRDLELRRVTPDGREVFLSMSGEPVFGRDAQFMGYRGVGRDVTAEKRAERNRQLLASIVEHTHDAVISRSLDGTILSWNKAAERIYGYRSEEVMGRNAAFLFGEDGEQVLEEMNRRVLAGEEGFESQAPRRSKSGASVDVAVSISPLKDAMGRLVGVTSIARDVSALVRAHSALQESDRRLSLALSIAGVETWEVDLSSGAIRSSEGLGPIFGRDARVSVQRSDGLARRHPSARPAAGGRTVRCRGIGEGGLRRRVCSAARPRQRRLGHLSLRLRAGCAGARAASHWHVDGPYRAAPVRAAVACGKGTGAGDLAIHRGCSDYDRRRWTRQLFESHSRATDGLGIGASSGSPRLGGIPCRGGGRTHTHEQPGGPGTRGGQKH